MKHFGLKAAVAALAALAALGGLSACGPLYPAYAVVLPPLPEAWEELLGSPHWRVEGVGPGGWYALSVPPAAGVTLEGSRLSWKGSTPVLAWPYWPERGLAPGMMRPAGALVPWDVAGEVITLSWRGGVDAFLWRELAQGDNPARAPRSFNWPRFRDLLAGGDVPEEIRRDPWAADWKTFIQKTLASGFDRRRIKKPAQRELLVPALGQSWLPSSPFLPPVSPGADGNLRLAAASEADTWVSAVGVLRFSARTWMFTPFP